MDDFHRQLARIAFAAGDELGLVLAGGYAISAHNLSSRPSRDLDLATASALPLPTITERLAEHFRAHGLTVSILTSEPRMARLEVTDESLSCEVDLLKEAIWPPVMLDIGPGIDALRSWAIAWSEDIRTRQAADPERNPPASEWDRYLDG